MGFYVYDQVVSYVVNAPSNCQPSATAGIRRRNTPFIDITSQFPHFSEHVAIFDLIKLLN